MGARDRSGVTPGWAGRRRARRAFNRQTPGSAQPRDAAGDLRRRAGRLIWTENLVKAIAPAVFFLTAYVAAALFGLASPWVFAALLFLAAASLIFGLFKLRRPSRALIEARIEAASGLKHRPLATLDDEPEDNNPLAAAIWQAHRARILATIGDARVGAPAPAAALQDPWSLRALLALLLITGLIAAGPAIPARLAGALALPAWPFPGPTVTAWITPPAYTGQPPQILDPGAAITALAGSKFTVITDGPSHAPPVHFAGTVIPSTALSGTSHRADATLQTSGTLLVGPWWHRLARWPVKIVPPGAPVITLTGLDITQFNHVKLHWRVTDAYGLTSMSAVIAPAGYPNALTQSDTLPANTGDNTAAIDLSTSPFHDLPVTLTLIATNAAGVAGTAAWPPKLVLPGLNLHDPTAISLDRLRQRLALNPNNVRAIATAMQRLAQAPLSTISASADIKLAVLTCALWLQQTTPRDAVDRMLELIEEIEAGPDYQPQQALQAANQALTAALQRALTGQPLDGAALAKLLQALQQALSAHLSALQPNPQSSPSAPSMDMSDLDRMAEQIAADEAAGRTQQAAQELQQFQKILSSLASARPMTPAEMAQAAAAGRAAGALTQITQGEAALLDRTHQGNASPAEQAGLQKQLNQLAQALAKAGIHLPGLNQAGAGMRSAQDALSQQDQEGAEFEENAVIAALQQAAAALAAQQRNSFGLGQQPSSDGQGQDSVNGGPDNQISPLDLNGTANPARAIEQQIIKQDSAPALPAQTHDYYNRLLQNGSSGQ